MPQAARYTDTEREAAFWEKVDKTDTCWLWTGALNRLGYGQIAARHPEHGYTTTIRAHRYAYELLVGPIPEGMVIDHLCRVRNCVNPAHMETVTQAENNRRAGHWNRGKTHCIRGHEFTEANTTIIRASGKRRCKTCAKIWRARWESKSRH